MPLQRLRRLSTFKRGFASTFVLDVTGRGFSAITLVLLLRTLSVESFAFVLLLLSVGQFMGGAATGGLRLRYVRIHAERVSRQLGQTSSFYSTLRTGTLLILGAGVLGYLGATAFDLGDTDERITFAVIATAYSLGHATIELSVYHYQAQVAFTKAGLISALRSLIQLVLALGATAELLTTGPAVGAAFAIGLCSAALVVAGPIAWSTRKARIDTEGHSGFGRESTALTIYSVASAGRAYGTTFLVALLLNDAAFVAYGTASRYMSIFIGPVPALLSVLRVRTAQRDLVDSERAQIGLMITWAKRTGLPMLILFALAAVAAPFAIPIVDGGKYPLSIPVFQVMLVAAFAYLVTLPNPGLLMTQKRYSLLAWVYTGSVIVTVVAVAALAGPLGVVGVAAAASVLSAGHDAVVTYLAAHPPKRVDPSPPAELVR